MKTSSTITEQEQEILDYIGSRLHETVNAICALPEDKYKEAKKTLYKILQYTDFELGNIIPEYKFKYNPDNTKFQKRRLNE